MSASKYKRVMLKLSGEMLGGDKNGGFDGDAVRMIADEVAELHEAGS